MGSLIKFELKKIYTQRVTQVAVIAIAALMVWVTTFNISSQYALDPNAVGKEFEGASAIVQQKENADALAGPITDKAATDAIREWKAFMAGDEIAERYQWGGANMGTDAKVYWDFYAPRTNYLSLIVGPWMQGFEMPVSVASRIDTTVTLDLYEQARQKVASELVGGNQAFTYSEAEQTFWKEKASSIQTPVEYGYAGGWLDFFDMSVFLIFALIVCAIACASVFNTEYREKTDAVLLSTKLGKSKLGTAKVVASVIVASVVYLVMLVVLLGVPLAFFGTEGAGLPLQLRELCNAYSLSLGAAVLVICVVGYLVMLGLLGVTLLLSSRMRSSMGILAIIAAIVIVPMMMSNLHNNVANHILFLFPYLALDANNFFDMVSYSLGPLVVEYPVALAIFYAALFIAGAVLSKRWFSKHQVA
ncbi:MAG: ABC transporter permease subunit [Eggerthellaceae bacterium]|nr:ABC transporter permease subunit [Eggerthellaceae bacterium]